MATAPPVDPLTTLRERLAAHARTMPTGARLIGLDATVKALDAAMVEQAKRQGEIANAVCVLAVELNQLRRWVIGANAQEVFTPETRERMRVIFEAGQQP